MTDPEHRREVTETEQAVIEEQVDRIGEQAIAGGLLMWQVRQIMDDQFDQLAEALDAEYEDK